MLCTRANARGKRLRQTSKQLHEIQDMSCSAGEHCTWPHMSTCCSAYLFELYFDAIFYFAITSLFARHIAPVAKTLATHPLCSICRFTDLAVCAPSSSSASSQLHCWRHILHKPAHATVHKTCCLSQELTILRISGQVAGIPCDASPFLAVYC